MLCGNGRGENFLNDAPESHRLYDRIVTTFSTRARTSIRSAPACTSSMNSSEGTPMCEQPLTAAQCDEVEKAMREDAAALPPGSPMREKLLQMANDYRLLADLKKSVLRQVN